MTRPISSREHQVLYLVAHERTAKEIADELFISNHTAISHRKNLMEKLHVRNTAGLVRRAFELGFLSL
jgi:DNA-binding CsgD family transcriptional regulator